MVKNVFKFLGKSPTWSLGFAQDGNDLIWAVIKNTSSGPVLHAYGKDHSQEKALENVKGISKDNIYISSVFASGSTLCRSLLLPKLKEREVHAALLDTLDQTTSLSVEDSVLTYESSKSKDGSWAIVAYMAQKTALESHIEFFKKYTLDPEYVIPKAASLAAFISHFSLSGWQYIIDIGVEETTLLLAYEGSVVESTSLAGGKTTLDSLENSSLNNEESIYQLLQHLREITTAYKERYDLTPTTPLTITGDVSSLLAITAITEAIAAPLSPLHTTDDTLDTSFLRSACAIGSAFLTGPTQLKNQLPDFRSDAFAFSKPLLHSKKPLITFCFFSFLLAGSLLWHGNDRAAKITTTMNEQWNLITKSTHTTPENVRKAAEQEGILLEEKEAISATGLVRQGEWLLSDIEKKSLFPLHPDVPRLSDFLVWLSTQITEAEKAEGAEPISLESCHYVLSSRPTKAHPKEKYQVRIDLEVATSSPVAARALHDKLLSQNQFVDPSTDVKWSGNNNKYRASFVLRDKTIYPVR